MSSEKKLSGYSGVFVANKMALTKAESKTGTTKSATHK